MCTIAERINNNRKSEFDKEFDKGAFLEFVEEQISKFGYVEIGIEQDRWFECGTMKNEVQVKKTDCKWLSFARWYKCYIWNTDCQIPQKFVNCVKSLLQQQGLKTNCKGACGYEEYDIIVAKL